MILALVRNYIPSYKIVVDGGWNIADAVARSYDLEGMQVGTVAAGRIGSAVLRRLKPFEVGLHYTDRHRLPQEVEAELGVTLHDNVESLVKVCDVVTINAPLDPETEHMFNEALIGKMQRGAYLVRTARGKICDATPSPAHSNPDSSPATPATSGSRSRRRKTIRSERCPTTA
jgi:formate dehydrogenase